MTITYYQRDTTDGHTWSIDTGFNAGHWQLSTTTAATGTVSYSWTGAQTAEFHWTTVTNQPNVADWPNGAFNVQSDIAAIGADILVNIGKVSRINTAGTGVLESSVDFIATAWSTTGLHAEAVTLDFTAGLANNRYGLSLVANNSNSHKSETLTFNVNTVDEYADGPWTGVPPSGTGAVSLSAVTVSGSGKQTLKATSIITLASTTVVGVGKHAFKATSAIALAALTVSGAAKQTFSATSGIILSSLIAVGVAKQTFSATAAIMLNSLTVVGVGKHGFTATGAITLSPLEVAGVGKQTFAATSSITLGPLTVASTGIQAFKATSNISLASIVVSGSGKLTFSATAAIMLNPLTVIGIGDNGVVVVTDAFRGFIANMGRMMR